jgi:uncharacterized phage protein (TIGR02218 family)
MEPFRAGANTGYALMPALTKYWDASTDPAVIGYMIRWATTAGSIDYETAGYFLGNVTSVVLPVPGMPGDSGTMTIGITAVDDLGDESTPVEDTFAYDFSDTEVPPVEIVTTGLTYTLAELFAFSLVNGVKAYFTNHDVPITYLGDTYQPLPIKRGPISYNTDMSVDKVSLQIGIVSVTLLGADHHSIPEIIHRGWLRGATATITLVDYESIATPGTLLFTGTLTSEIGYNGGILTVQIGSVLDRLSDQVPKNVYSEFCPHQLYGPHCGLVATAWEESDTVTSNIADEIHAPIFAWSHHPEGYWTKGKVTVNDGLNALDARTVKIHSDGYVTFNKPFFSPVLSGASITAIPGCDKAGPTCADKFDNYANFLGFEYVPKPEEILG